MSQTQRSCDESLLFPPLRLRLDAGLQQARLVGLSVFLFEGWRGPERQAELYAQGRTSPGPIVTDAGPWKSWHQYGMAADLAFGGPGLWTWSGDWQRLGRLLEAHGLEWYGAPGATFKETPHFQLTCGLTLAEAEALSKTSGLLAVWASALAKLEAAAQKTT